MRKPIPKNCAAPDAIQGAVPADQVEHLVQRWRFLRRRVGRMTGLRVGDRELDGHTWAYMPRLPDRMHTALRVEVFRRARTWRRCA